MPSWAELSAASNVGHHIHVLLLAQPDGPHDGGVDGSHGDLEAAIAVQDRGVSAVQHQVLVADQEVRDLEISIKCSYNIIRIPRNH